MQDTLSPYTRCMHSQNIVIIAQQNWNTIIGTNPRNMAKEFARHNRVLYVNMPLDISTVVREYREPDVRQRLRVLFGKDEDLTQAEPNIWVLTTRVLLLSANWLKSKTLFSAVNRLNAWLLARNIRKAARKVGFDSYYLFQDGLIYPGLELKRLLKPIQFIYNIRDYVMGVPYFQRHGPWLEAAITKQADVVAANSAYLRDYSLQHNEQSFDIGQGCVLSMYQAEAAHALPPDLADVPHPRLVYTGNLTALRLDLELLLSLARQRPHWNLVLIGPEDEDFGRSALHQLPNVFFLGTKLPQQLAAYLHHCDVCINPQIVNDITIGNYPLKIDEYLAMGRPVVATRTRAMEFFADHVYLASGTTGWLAAIEQALHDQGPSLANDRIDFARSHTWEATVGLLYQAITKVAGQKATSSHPVGSNR